MLLGMDWVTVGLILLAVIAYAAVVFYVRRRIAAEEAAGAALAEGSDDAAVPEGERPPSGRKGWFSEHVTFYGPILALRTLRVHFFDVFRRISWPLRAYASVGVVAVALISALFAFSLFFSLRYTLQVRPEPTGIYAPQNLLLIPGLNEFVPGTVAVWLALVLTLVVHEFGHGILSRVEGIKVKAAGLLVAVVPIGAFVEPDEEELEKAPRWSKMRMYGAGISNNIVFGLLSFFLMIVVFGLAVPIAAPVVSGVYKDYPAYNASVAPGSIVLALNGTPVENREDVARLLAPTQPGDHTSLTVEQDGVVTTSELTLAEWPSGNHTSGFMGVEYYNGQAVQEYVQGSFNLIGILRYLILPFDTSSAGQALRIVGFPGANTDYWIAPFWGFWGLVQLLFWSGWINLNVGIFNALPMIPFDGGYIFREAVDGVLSRRRLEKYTPAVVSAVSWLMAVTLVSLIALPYLFSLFS
jgi:membrane-associated protease RseP (regulator of RpoE activity)